MKTPYINEITHRISKEAFETESLLFNQETKDQSFIKGNVK